MQKNAKKYILGWLLFIVLALPIGFLIVSRTEACVVAKRFLGQAPVVLDSVGRINDFSLTWSGLDYRWEGDTGHAELPIQVSGDKGKGSAVVDLDMKQGIWHVKQASFIFDGKSVQLDVGNQ